MGRMDGGRQGFSGEAAFERNLVGCSSRNSLGGNME